MVFSVNINSFNKVETLIMFNGKGNIYEEVKYLYNINGLVEFNNKVYMNGELFHKYIKEYVLLGLEGTPS